MYVCCITDNIVCCITDNIVCCMYFCLRPKAKDQRPRNYLSCCSSSSCWIFCLIYALSTPSTILPLLSISPSSLSLSFLSLWFLSLSLSLPLPPYSYVLWPLPNFDFTLSISSLPLLLLSPPCLYCSSLSHLSITISICQSINWYSIAANPGAGIGLVYCSSLSFLKSKCPQTQTYGARHLSC